MYCKCGCGNITPKAKENRPSLGYKKGDYVNYIPGHNLRLKEAMEKSAEISRRLLTKPFSVRFWGKIKKDESTGCWNWTAHCMRQGYGFFSWKENGRTLHGRAHRIAYQKLVGEIPKGILVCHKCDNRKCCNPEHLFLGTHKDNYQDSQIKGRDIHSIRKRLLSENL